MLREWLLDFGAIVPEHRSVYDLTCKTYALTLRYVTVEPALIVVEVAADHGGIAALILTVAVSRLWSFRSIASTDMWRRNKAQLLNMGLHDRCLIDVEVE